MSDGRTIRARRLADGALVEILPDGFARPFPPSETDWRALRRLTDEEVHAAAASDPDNPPLTPLSLKRMTRVPQVRVVRRALHLTEAEFAACFRIPHGQLRAWERGEDEPDAAARAYLTVIARNPLAVMEALKGRGV